MPRLLKLSAALLALGLTACVTVPDGPSLAAMPGRAKSFEAFQYDDSMCRDYALNQIGGAFGGGYALGGRLAGGYTPLDADG